MYRTTEKRRFWHALLVLGLVAGLGGCTDFLDDLVGVDAPDRITADTYETPDNVPTIMAGVIADFECALAGYVAAAGVAGDEIMITDALTAPELLDKREWDTRGLGAAWGTSTCGGWNEGTPPIYRPLSTARWQAENVLTLLEGWTDEEVPNRTFHIATAAAYAGYALTILGEAMCELPLDMGPALTPDSIFGVAEARFERAMTAAQAVGASADDLLNMARVGMARARLNRGNASGAATVAQDVPAGFTKNAVYSTASPRRYNAIFNYVQGNSTTIDPNYRNMQYEDVDDPRVPVFDTGRLTPGVNLPLWDQSKYPTRDAPIEIATYEEAQLIIAEAELEAGNPGVAANIIDALHTAEGLPGFSSTDPAVVMDQLLYERRAEFFLEGHRFGDIRRYNVTLDPAPGTPYHTGGEYLDARCFPIPGIEIDANPNLSD